MLDDLDEFIAACVANSRSLIGWDQHAGFVANDIYCPTCGGPRRAHIRALRTNILKGDSLNLADTSTEAIAEQLAPALFRLSCSQGCRTTFTAVLFRGPEKYELAVFPSRRGGLAQPHTPPSVAYYLDQAARAESVGANSAAIAMYRAALEHLLFEQGFTTRMLGPKLQALETAIEDGTAPQWARSLDRRYLSVLKKLGDAAIHPGDGDVSRQDALNEKLLRNVKVTFTELLNAVYEQPEEREERLRSLQDSLAELEGG